MQSNGIKAIKDDMASIQNDLSTLKSLGASPSMDPSSAIATGNQALKNAANAISWAQGTGNGISEQAQALATQAANYASSIGCP